MTVPEMVSGPVMDQVTRRFALYKLQKAGMKDVFAESRLELLHTRFQNSYISFRYSRFDTYLYEMTPFPRTVFMPDEIDLEMWVTLFGEPDEPATDARLFAIVFNETLRRHDIPLKLEADPRFPELLYRFIP